MDKKAIGFKIKLNIILVVLMILAGIALIVGAVLLFLFVIGGAIGGGIAGATIAFGIMLCTIAINSRRLPNELVFIDDKFLYTYKTTIDLNQIENVKNQGITLLVKPKQGKAIRQSFLKNSSDCAIQIIEKLNSIKVDKIPK